MREVMAFRWDGETLVGTHDAAAGTTGLLIVSGGNEIRIGAHRGMAMLAQRLAARGIPVFRFDRRGIGDSTGTNRGFLSSAPDIAAAAAAFRATSSIERLVGFGNCDAATALALFGAQAGIDRLVLANPWVVEQTDDLPPAAAIRARYGAKLRDPREWLRLLSGGVNVSKVIRGLGKLTRGRSTEAVLLADRFIAGATDHRLQTTILLAERDNTAIAFGDAWSGHRPAPPTTIDIRRCDTASHSFAGAAAEQWLEHQLVSLIAQP